jgi:hypothetical protein
MLLFGTSANHISFYLQNDYMDKNFIIKIESLHLADTGKTENVSNISADTEVLIH